MVWISLYLCLRAVANALQASLSTSPPPYTSPLPSLLATRCEKKLLKADLEEELDSLFEAYPYFLRACPPGGLLSLSSHITSKPGIDTLGLPSSRKHWFLGLPRTEDEIWILLRIWHKRRKQWLLGAGARKLTVRGWGWMWDVAKTVLLWGIYWQVQRQARVLGYMIRTLNS